MKKIALIILCLTCSMMLSAQIQRNILGQTLGVSTKDEVYSSLLSKGAFFENMMGEEAIFVKDVRFGGYPWSVVMLFFYNNVLYKAILVDSSDDITIDAKKKWTQITNLLDTKYSKYKHIEEELNKSYGDLHTFLVISIASGQVSMMYSDVELEFKKSNKEASEF